MTYENEPFDEENEFFGHNDFNVDMILYYI